MDNNHFLELRVPPPIVFSVFAGLMWLLARKIPATTFAIPGYKSMAMTAVALGGVFCVVGILSLLRAKTTINPHKPGKSTSLVVTGVYTITRNPMYLAFLLVLIGWAIYLSNLLSFLLHFFYRVP